MLIGTLSCIERLSYEQKLYWEIKLFVSITLQQLFNKILNFSFNLYISSINL